MGKMVKADFVLVPEDQILQENIERYQKYLIDARGSRTLEELAFSEYNRHQVEAAIAAGFFESLPDGFDKTQLGKVRANTIRAVADMVMAFYIEVMQPDESFT